MIKTTDEDFKVKDVYDLQMELIIRIRKLRRALQKISIPDKYSRREQDPSTTAGYFQGVAQKALEKDEQKD